jgi:medium-chain acyl-[acyl-carrier-protein] hydrolase
VELPGRGGQMKSSPFTQMEPLVRAIAPIMLPYFRQTIRFFRA